MFKYIYILNIHITYTYIYIYYIFISYIYIYICMYSRKQHYCRNGYAEYHKQDEPTDGYIWAILVPLFTKTWHFDRQEENDGKV